MTVILPDFGTHRFRPEYGPFRNLCALSDEEAEGILQQMRDKYGYTWMVPEYLQERRVIETWLREEFRSKGGKILTEHPIYFYLGAPPKDSASCTIDSSTHEIRVPMPMFDKDTVSFTYPDSMISYGISHQERGRPYRKHYHGQVFTYEEIKQAVATYGFPGESSKRHLQTPYDRVIEMQIWDSSSLAAFA